MVLTLKRPPRTFACLLGVFLLAGALDVRAARFHGQRWPANSSGGMTTNTSYALADTDAEGRALELAAAVRDSFKGCPPHAPFRNPLLAVSS